MWEQDPLALHYPSVLDLLLCTLVVDSIEPLPENSVLLHQVHELFLFSLPLDTVNGLLTAEDLRLKQNFPEALVEVHEIDATRDHRLDVSLHFLLHRENVSLDLRVVPVQFVKIA